MREGRRREPLREAPLGVLWQQLRLPGRLKRGDVDLLWSPLITLPMRCPVPAVATVHDLTVLLYPEAHTLKVRASLLPFLRPSFEEGVQVRSRMWIVEAMHWQRRAGEKKCFLAGCSAARFQAPVPAAAPAPAPASLSRLCAVHNKLHSPATFCSPRRRNCRNPRAYLICPNTGSTTCFRSR